ncbi:unnamed protein product, partial [Polarella glacialis]
VTPDTFEGNGWSGDVDRILIYHFLNGESDKGSSLDASGTWTREHGHYTEEGGASPGDCKADGRVSLMDLFYGQEASASTCSVGDSAGRPPPRAASLEELLEAARKGTAKALGL